MPSPAPSQLNPPLPWTPGLIPEWDVLATKTALQCHEEGMFQAPAQMATAMGRDDRVTAVVETRVKGLLSLPFQMHAAEVPRAKTRARKIAEEVEEHWEHIAPACEVTNALWWFILMGVAPIQITWSTVDGTWVPTFTAWDPQFMHWDPEERVLKMQTRDGQVDVTPENGWYVFTQGERGWMRGAIRAIAVHWISRQWVLRDWNRYNERHGLPVLKAKVPASATAPQKAEFYRNMSQLGASTTALLPQGQDGVESGFDLELLEAKDRSWESFQGLEKSCNKNIAVHVLGQNLTTEVEGGSLAAANIHNMVRLDRLQGDAKLLSEGLRKALLEPMVVFNFGEQARKLTPSPHWDTAPPADLVERGDSLKKLGEGIASIKASGYTLDSDTVEELGQEFNVKLTESEVEPGEVEPGETEPDETAPDEKLKEAS